MGPKAALILLTVGSPVLLALMLVGGPAVVWLGVPIISGLPFLFILIGAGRDRPPGGYLWSMWILICGSWFGLFWLSSHVDLVRPTPLQAGLVVVLMLLGLGLVPLFLTAWVFARTFRSEGLAPEDLRRLSGDLDR